MKTRSYLALFAGLLLAGAVFYSFSKEGSLSGRFSATSSGLCAGTSLTTLYFDGGATDPRANGSRVFPYYDVTALEAALAADGTVDRVCFTGTVGATLNLDSALSPALTLESYSSRATWNLGHVAGLAIELTPAAISTTELTLSNIYFLDGLDLSPADTLTVRNVTVDTGGDAAALNTNSTARVNLIGSTFEDFDTVTRMIDVDELYVSGCSFAEYGDTGLWVTSIPVVTVQKSSFDGSVGSWSNGLFVTEDAVDTTMLSFKNNFVFNNGQRGIRVDSGSPSLLTAEIVNNSFSNNEKAFDRVGDMTVYNNIFVTASHAASQVFGYDTPTISFVSDYNLFQGNISSTAAALAEWQAEEGVDASSGTGDPLFVSPTSDLHISAGSPAIDKGTALSDVTDDIDGDDRGSFIDRLYDIGADEY